jgi:hypothetical protein
MSLARVLVIAVFVGAGVLAGAAPRAPDPRLGEVAPLFREFSPSLDRFGVITEASLPGGYGLVVVQAMTPDEKVDRSLKGDDFFRQEAYGVFVFDGDGRVHMKVDIFPSQAWHDGWIDILKAGDEGCVVRYFGDTYGQDFGTRKYFYDLDGRRVLSSVVHYGFNVTDMVQVGPAIHFLLDDARERWDLGSMLLRLDSVGRLADSTAYSITESILGRPIPAISRMVANGGALLLQTKVDAPAGEFLAVPGPTHPSGVYDMSSTPPRLHEIPIPDVQTFCDYRPRLTEWLGGRESIRGLEANMGAFQYADELIWFGTSFYDGEGTTGVGAVGYFDTNARSFHIVYDAVLADWSCTALLLEQDALWVGLANQPEGAQRPGGLARYDRRSGAFEHYDIPAIVHVIRRYGRTLFVGTSNGVYALDGDTLRHVALDFDVTGQVVVEVTTVER